MSSHKQLRRHHVFIARIKRLGTVVVVIVYVLSSLDMIISAVIVIAFANKQLPIDDLHTLNLQAVFIGISGKGCSKHLDHMCCL